MRMNRFAVTLAAAALMTSAVAACGSSDDSSTTPGGATAATTAEAGGSGVADARRELAPALEYPDSIGITEPLRGSVAGKTVDYMECGVTECKVTADLLEEAVEPLGIRLNRVPAGNTPESLARAFDLAVQNRPDGVIASGVSKALFAKQLASLRRLGIPVVLTGTSDRPGDGIAQVMIGPDAWSKGGQYAADWTIVDSDGKARALLVAAPVFDFNRPLAEGFESAMRRNCPGCEVEVMDVSAEDIGKGVPGQIVSYLQQHPETDYVVTAFGSLMVGVPQAIQAAGLRDQAKLLSVAPGQVDFQNTKAGIEHANVASSKQYLSWMTIDQIARAMTGQDPAALVDDGDLPWWHIFTGPDQDWDVAKEVDWPYFDGFQDQFKQLWGVSQSDAG